MGFTIRAALASDAPAIGSLANQFAGYLRGLGDRTDFKLTAEAYLRDGFGLRPAFEGLVAEEKGRVIGYLLYHFGYDSDGAFRNLHIVDLYVDAKARKQGVGRGLMMAVAAVARASDAQEMIWFVYHANDLAAAFYEGLGAQKITDLFFMRLPSDAL
jgi:ribosomal protein S18 acetylase RimI-like enzyme